ncbi:MAG: hypothetical protein ABIK28_11260, partial [Planctomycetota bacterium]
PDILMKRPDLVTKINEWFDRFDISYGLKVEILKRNLFSLSLIDKKTVGVHAWNHRLWQDHLNELPLQKIRDELGRACEHYEKILGHRPGSTAAPAWLCNELSLRVQDELGLDYSSDTRGDSPFFPVIKGQGFKTMQIPTTMTCLEEVMGRDMDLARSVYLSGELREDAPNVFPVHAEVEGNVYRTIFHDRLRETLDRGVRYFPLRELHETYRKQDLPSSPVICREIPGRGGVVAVQDTRSAGCNVQRSPQ